MTVQLSASWWKGAKPKTLDTKEMDRAFEEFEDAKKADEGRRNIHKVRAPDALRALIKAADATNERANKVAHAQTKKNLTAIAKALAAGNFAVIAKIAENELKPAPAKLDVYIKEW